MLKRLPINSNDVIEAVLHLPLKTHLPPPPMYFRDISVHSGRNICTQGLLYDRNGDISRFYATTDFFEDFFQT